MYVWDASTCMCAHAETRGEHQVSYSIILFVPLRLDFSLNLVPAILVRPGGQHTSRISLSLPHPPLVLGLQTPLDMLNFYVVLGSKTQVPSAYTANHLTCCDISYPSLQYKE